MQKTPRLECKWSEQWTNLKTNANLRRDASLISAHRCPSGKTCASSWRRRGRRWPRRWVPAWCFPRRRATPGEITRNGTSHPPADGRWSSDMTSWPRCCGGFKTHQKRRNSARMNWVLPLSKFTSRGPIRGARRSVHCRSTHSWRCSRKTLPNSGRRENLQRKTT